MTHALVLLMTLLSSAGVAVTAPATTSNSESVSIHWEELPAMSVPRAGHSMVDSDNGPISFGGTTFDGDKKRWLSDAWLFDVKANTWRQQGDLPLPTGYAIVARADSNWLLIGGANAGGGLTRVATCPKADQDGGPRIPPLPTPRSIAGGATVDHCVVVVGGATDPSVLASATDSVIRTDLSVKPPRWEPAAVIPGGPLILPATAACNGRLFVFGGMARGATGEPVNTKAAMSYRPDLDRWAVLSPLPTARRGAVAVALDDRRIAIIGGCLTVNNAPVMTDAVLIYDTVEDRYDHADSLPYAAMVVGAVMHKGQLYVCGGEDRPRGRSARVCVGTIRSH